MINPAELVRRPVRERDLLPVATDAQAIEYFQRNIEDVRREVIVPIRAPHYDHNKTLLFISGSEQDSLIGGDYDRGKAIRYPKFKMEQRHAQDLLFKAMEAYGFDATKFKPARRYNYKTEENEDDVTINPDGTTREVFSYPSRIQGLDFVRMRDFVTGTEQTTDVRWEVIDKGPQFKVDVPSIFRRKPKPQIKLD